MPFASRLILVAPLVVGALALASGPVFAWGSKGHRIIGALAEERLTATARMEITRLLGNDDLAVTAIWADEMRGAQDNTAFWSDYAATWHYVNIPAGGSYATARKEPHGDALLALATFSAILLNEPLPAGGVQDGLKLYFKGNDLHSTEVKRFALKFLVHILGDLQQPLHGGHADDRGGNAIEFTWQGRKTNLHSLWDSGLLDYNKVDEATYARRLRSRLERVPASDLRGYEQADAATWLRESARTLERIYAHMPDGRVNEKDYAAEFVPTVELQLLKGGVRTAWFLNNIFGGWEVGSQ